MEILPAVEEANSISEELDKKKKFEVVLVSPEARGEIGGRMQVSLGQEISHLIDLIISPICLTKYLVATYTLLI